MTFFLLPDKEHYNDVPSLTRQRTPQWHDFTYQTKNTTMTFLHLPDKEHHNDMTSLTRQRTPQWRDFTYQTKNTTMTWQNLLRTDPTTDRSWSVYLPVCNITFSCTERQSASIAKQNTFLSDEKSENNHWPVAILHHNQWPQYNQYWPGSSLSINHETTRGEGNVIVTP